MVRKILSVAIPIVLLLVMLYLGSYQLAQPHIPTPEELTASVIAIAGLIIWFWQFVNPLELFKGYGLGGYIPFPWFHWQLIGQLKERQNFHKANLVGEGKRFVKELYIERREAEIEFDLFLKSTRRIFAVFGESGVGKTNLLIGLSDKIQSLNPYLFYQGMHLKNGLKERLAEDLPWAFRGDKSLLEAGRLISARIHYGENDLVIFLDALDDLPSEFRLSLVEEIRLLAELGIRFVVSCKDVIWPSYIKTEGLENSWTKIVSPNNSDKSVPGYHLERCSIEERDSAWNKYSKRFDLRGELSEELHEEISLLYLLRLIGETFQGQTVPTDLNSRELFLAYWAKKQDEIGFPLDCLIVVKNFARALLELKKTEVSDAEIWPAGMPNHIKRAFDGLVTENVILCRNENHRRMLSFSHEKFQSFAISILLGEWDKRANNEGVKELAAELSLLATNPVIVSAFEFFILAYDKGESPLCAELLEKDIVSIVSYFSQVREPWSFSNEKKDISDQVSISLVRKFEQLVRIMTILYGKYFPVLSSDFYNHNIGGLISIQGNYLARAFTYSAQPGQVIRDDSIDLKNLDWNGFNITGSLTSGHWQGFYESIPIIEAIRLLAEDLSKVLKRSRSLVDHNFPIVFAELNVPELVYERIWFFLFSCEMRGYRRGESGRRVGAYRSLHFHNIEEVLYSTLEELIYRVKYEIVWLFVQNENMVELEKLPNGGTYTTPENVIVDEKTTTEWDTARYLSKSDFAARYIGNRTLHAYKDLIEALWSVDPSDPDLFTALREYGSLKEPSWSSASDEELRAFFSPIVAKLTESFRALVSASFPEISRFFSFDLIEECLAFWQFQAKNRPYVGVRLALMDKIALKADQKSNISLIVNEDILPYNTYPVPLKIEFGDKTYSAFASVSYLEIWDFPLKELILSLIKSDLYALFGRMRFWHLW